MIALQRIRSLGIDAAASAMNWNSSHLLASRSDLVFRFGWWVEMRVLSSLFGFFYDGSDEEILSALNGETPRKYMSLRQREFAHAAMNEDLKWSSFFGEFFCGDCDAELSASDEARLCAACRALHPEMLLEDRK